MSNISHITWLALVVPHFGIHIFYWWKLQGLRSSAILRHQLWELRCHPTFRHVKVWLGKMDVVLSKRSFGFIKIQKTMITYLCFPTQGGMRTRVWEKWRVWILSACSIALFGWYWELLKILRIKMTKCFSLFSTNTFSTLKMVLRILKILEILKILRCQNVSFSYPSTRDFPKK